MLILVFWSSSARVLALSGPSSSLPDHFYGTLTYFNGESSVSSDGKMGTGGKTINISYNADSGYSGSIYWGPGNSSPVSISLDDQAYGASENLAYSSSDSNLANGTAVWRGSTYIYYWFANAYWINSQFQTRFTMTVTTSSGSKVTLLTSSSVGAGSNPGVLVPMTAGTVYKVVMAFEVWDGSRWQAALNYFNDLHTSGITTKYTFNYGYYYDRAPTGISIGSNSVNENLASGTTVGTLSLTDPDPGGATYTLVSGDGSTDNASFSIDGTSLKTRAVFDYETKNQYSIRVRVTDEKAGYFEKSLSIAVGNVNEAPVARTITAVTKTEDFGTHTLDVSSYFTDSDFSAGTSSLTYSVASGNTTLATASIANSTISLRSVTDANGTATITVSANDGQYTTSTSFTLTVTAVNDAPVAATTPSVTVNEDFGTQTINVSSWFRDVDSSLSYSVVQVLASDLRTASSMVSASISGNFLTLTSAKDLNGTCKVKVRASDGSATADNVLDVIVTAVNDAPFFTKGSNITINEDAGTTSTTFQNWATSISAGASDETDVLTFLVSNNNTSLFSSQPAISASGVLTFALAANQSGSATISIFLKDSLNATNSTVATTALITVNAVNDAPTITSTLPVRYDEEPDPITLATPSAKSVSLSGISAGPSESTQTLTISASVLYQSASGLINSPSVLYTQGASTGTLQFTLGQYVNGTATIRLTLVDNGGTSNSGVNTTTQDISVTVDHRDHYPVVSSTATKTVSINEDSGSTSVSLNGAFLDRDGDSFSLLSASSSDVTKLKVSSSSVGNNNGIIASLTLTTVTNTYTKVNTADAPVSVSVVATANSKSVTNVITVSIVEVNDDPTLDPIGNQTIDEDGGINVIPLSGISPGSNESSIDSVAATGITATSSNATLISDSMISITGYSATAGTANLNYTTTPLQTGNAQITVTVRDARGGSVIRTFNVKVNPINHAPAAANPLPEPFKSQPTRNGTPLFSYLEDQPLTIIPLNTLFSDVDGDTVSKFVFANTNATLVQALTGSDAGNNLILTFTPEAFGTTEVTVRGTDGFLYETFTFYVDVLQVNDAPVLNPISNQSVEEDATIPALALTGISAGPVNETNQFVQTITAQLLSESTPGLISSLRVDYVTNTTSATLTYALGRDLNGKASIRVTVKDSGGTANGGVDSFYRDFQITVIPASDEPILVKPRGTIVALEDQFAGQNYKTNINLDGVFEDRNKIGVPVNLLLDRITDRDNILNDEVVNQVKFDDINRQLLLLGFRQHGYGTAIINYKGISEGIVSSLSDALTIQVLPVNDPPSFNQVSNQSVNEDSGPHQAQVLNIATGPTNEVAQKIISVTAAVVSESTPGLIAATSATYPGSGSTASVSYSLGSQLEGTATIRVTIRDDGGTADGGNDTAYQDFTVTVNHVDDFPVLDHAAGAISSLEDLFAGADAIRLVDLQGLFYDTDGLDVHLLLRAIRDPDNILNNEDGDVQFHPDHPEQLLLEYHANAFGTAEIDLGALAHGLTSPDTTTLRVRVVPVNDPPTINLITNIVMDASSPARNLVLTGISPGPLESSVQKVTNVIAEIVSQSPVDLLAAAPAITYSAGSSSATLQFALTPRRAGAATIRVTVQDDGGIENGGINTTSTEFLISVDRPKPGPVLAQAPTPRSFAEEELGGDSSIRRIDLRGVFAVEDNSALQLVLDSINDTDNIVTNAYFDSLDPEFLVVQFNQDQSGQASINFRGFANRRLSAELAALSLTVTHQNDAPTIDPIYRQNVFEDGGPYTVGLTGLSAGPNEGDQTFTVTAEFFPLSPTNLISALSVDHVGTNSTATLTYSLTPGLSGLAKIRVTVQDLHGHSTYREFRVSVQDANGSPIRVRETVDVTFQEDQFTATTNLTSVDLRSLFDDPENNPVQLLLREIVDAANVLNDERALVRVDPINTESVILAFQPNSFGTASLRLGASAHGVAATNESIFNITVTPVNDPPTAAAVPTQRVAEGSAPPAVILSGITTGPANEKTQVISSINAEVVAGGNLINGPVTVSLNDPPTTATVRYALVPHENGTATIRLILRDNGGTDAGGEDSSSLFFNVEVSPVDVPPSLVAGQELIVKHYSEPELAAVGRNIALDLTEVFSDADGDTIQLVVASLADGDDILNNETPGLLKLDPQNSEILFLPFREFAYGTATLRVQALAAGKFSSGMATVQISTGPANGAPSFSAIKPVSLFESSGANSIAIRGIRPGVGAANIVSLTATTLASNPAGLISSATIEYTTGAKEGVLRVSLAPQMAGSATLRLTLVDDGPVSDTRTNTFTGDVQITVLPADDPPRRSAKLFTDPTYLEDAFVLSSRQTSVDLSGIFVDDDGDRVSLIVHSVSDPSNMLEEEIGNVRVDSVNPEKLLLTFRKDAFGEANLTLLGRANRVSSSDTFNLKITVTPVNDPPTLDALSSLNVSQRGTISVPLSGLSPGPSNENQTVVSITPSVVSSSDPALIQNLSVVYTAGSATGALQFNINSLFTVGSARIRLDVKDNGTVENGGQNLFSREFALNVSIAKPPPTLANRKGTVTFNEDQFVTTSQQTTVSLANVFTSAEGDPIEIVLGAITDPQDILNNETAGLIRIDSANKQLLRLAFRAHAFGTAQISYKALAAGVLSDVSDTLTVIVLPINDAPSFSAIPAQTVQQGSPQAIFLRDLTVGPLESAQKIKRLSASIVSQSPTGLLTAEPTVTSQASITTATVRYLLNPALSGNARIRVTIEDDGGTESGGVDTFSSEFNLTVTPVDHPPALATALPSGALPQTFLEDQFSTVSYRTSLDLSGLFVDPDGDPVSLLLGAVSDPNDLLDNENGNVRFDSANRNLLVLTFKPNGFGAARIPVRGAAMGLQSEAYEIEITVTGVNDAPALGVIPAVAVDQDSGAKTITLSGINPGPAESGRQSILAVSAVIVSANPSGLFTGTPVIAYTPSATSGTLTFTPASGQNGSATVRVTVQDAGGTANGGIDSFAREFTITVRPPAPVDHPPILAQPKGTTNFTISSIAAQDGIVEINLAGVFSDEDGDAISLFLSGLVDESDILANETPGAIKFDAARPEVLLLTFKTNVAGTARISYLAIANSQLSAQADTLTINVTASLGSAAASPELAAATIPDSSTRPIVLGVPQAGYALIAVENNRLLEPGQIVWQLADDADGLNLREIAERSSNEVVVRATWQGRYVRVSRGAPNRQGAIAAPVSDFVPIPVLSLTFSQWLTAHAIVGSAGHGDVDSDGLSNLAEYLLGSDPTVADGPAFILSFDSAGGMLEYVLPKGRGAAQLRVESSSDLQNWGLSGVTELGSRETATLVFRRFRVPASAPAGFFRARIVTIND